MKTVVLMPVVDSPIGSGNPHFFLQHAVRSVFDSGLGDVELWCGVDGDLPEIEKALDSDPRIKVFRFEKTHSRGNAQRRRMMEALPHGCLFGFMDHDDCYAEGGLKALHDTSVKHGGSPVSGMLAARFHRMIHDRHFLKSAGGIMPQGEWNGTQACIFVSAEGMPLWGTSDKAHEDIVFCSAAERWQLERGKPTVYIDRIVANIRPWEDEYEFRMAVSRERGVLP